LSAEASIPARKAFAKGGGGEGKLKRGRGNLQSQKKGRDFSNREPSHKEQEGGMHRYGPTRGWCPVRGKGEKKKIRQAREKHYMQKQGTTPRINYFACKMVGTLGTRKGKGTTSHTA